jgi:NAD(P)-dependent dehydrogenase (short-subunit alcohol dehydrogenase family)
MGQALAQYIATRTSNRLVATARNPAFLSAIPDNDNILKLSLDITSKPSVDAAIVASLAKFGRLDVVVNNAGYGLLGDTEGATEAQARSQIETLFWGTERITVHAMRIMREENPKTGRKGGVVINVTSMAGFVGFAAMSYYNAGKFAVEGFTDAVAKEVHPDWNSK